MSEPTGYWVETVDGGDAWWHGDCARDQGVNLDRPMDSKDLFMLMPCGWCAFPEDQNREMWV
jgi:hypothetical protein